LVKAPKLYFLDTVLVCFLLGIRQSQQLESHPLKGAIFETYAYSEILKSKYNRVEKEDIFYFRDRIGER